MLFSDVCVIGGGIIGLSVALELERRGATVTVVERGHLLGAASQAAAGMLAADDPENPAELADLARLSLSAYGEFLGRIEALSGVVVPFQTGATFQAVEGAGGEKDFDLPAGLVAAGRRFLRLVEHSLDPRQMATGLGEAVRRSAVRVMTGTDLRGVTEGLGGVTLTTSQGELSAGQVVYAMGAWSGAWVKPRKGQMLAVEAPFAMEYVVRTPEIYMVPRLVGPRAGQIVIGATVEDAGFSLETDARSLEWLRGMAAEMLPDLRDAPAVEWWAGLRPDTPDHLPLIGRMGERTLVATGHYRNGILLAPGTAKVMAALVLGEDAGVDLEAFSPGRFSEAGSFRTGQTIFAPGS